MAVIPRNRTQIQPQLPAAPFLNPVRVGIRAVGSGAAAVQGFERFQAGEQQRQLNRNAQQIRQDQADALAEDAVRNARFRELEIEQRERIALQQSEALGSLGDAVTDHLIGVSEGNQIDGLRVGATAFGNDVIDKLEATIETEEGQRQFRARASGVLDQMELRVQGVEQSRKNDRAEASFMNNKQRILQKIPLVDTPGALNAIYEELELIVNTWAAAGNLGNSDEEVEFAARAAKGEADAVLIDHRLANKQYAQLDNEIRSGLFRYIPREYLSTAQARAAAGTEAERVAGLKLEIDSKGLLFEEGFIQPRVGRDIVTEGGLSQQSATQLILYSRRNKERLSREFDAWKTGMEMVVGGVKYEGLPGQKKGLDAAFNYFMTKRGGPPGTNAPTADNYPGDASPGEATFEDVVWFAKTTQGVPSLHMSSMVSRLNDDNSTVDDRVGAMQELRLLDEATGGVTRRGINADANTSQKEALQLADDIEEQLGVDRPGAIPAGLGGMSEQSRRQFAVAEAIRLRDERRAAGTVEKDERAQFLAQSNGFATPEDMLFSDLTEQFADDIIVHDPTGSIGAWDLRGGDIQIPLPGKVTFEDAMDKSDGTALNFPLVMRNDLIRLYQGNLSAGQSRKSALGNAFASVQELWQFGTLNSGQWEWEAFSPDRLPMSTVDNSKHAYVPHDTQIKIQEQFKKLGIVGARELAIGRADSTPAEEFQTLKEAYSVPHGTRPPFRPGEDSLLALPFKQFGRALDVNLRAAVGAVLGFSDPQYQEAYLDNLERIADLVLPHVFPTAEPQGPVTESGEIPADLGPRGQGKEIALGLMRNAFVATVPPDVRLMAAPGNIIGTDPTDVGYMVMVRFGVEENGRDRFLPIPDEFGKPMIIKFNPKDSPYLAERTKRVEHQNAKADELTRMMQTIGSGRAHPELGTVFGPETATQAGVALAHEMPREMRRTAAQMILDNPPTAFAEFQKMQARMAEGPDPRFQSGP